MKSITFSKEVEINVDIYDVWEEMSENDKDYFCREEGLSRNHQSTVMIGKILCINYLMMTFKIL